MMQHCVNEVGLVIFDCDGVLIDSEIIMCRIEAEELTRIGYAITPEEVVRRFTGLADKKMQALIEEDWQRPLPDDFASSVKARCASAYRNELKAIQGAAEVIARLLVPVCVASSSAPAKLRLGLEVTGLEKLFAPNIFSSTMVARGKPEPDLFLFAAEKMKMPASCCLVIEDSTAGVRAARAAGMRVFGFCGASHCLPDHADRLLGSGAEIVFGNMLQLLELLHPPHIAQCRGKRSWPQQTRSEPTGNGTGGDSHTRELARFALP